MSEEQKKQLEAQLWNIANELRGKMDADGFRDYILGFIFFKYLSEMQYLYANQLLETEEINDYVKVTDVEDLAAIRDESLLKLDYFLRPNELFSAIAKKGSADTEDQSNFILEDLETILNGIE
jgi:type I restriction enzyme M protein